MVRRLWLLSLILTIPVMGLFTSETIEAYLNSELRQAARTEVPDLDPEALSRLTLKGICQTGDSELASLCADHRNLRLLRAGAIGSGALGAALILAIGLAGTAARSNRRLLWAFFKSGFQLIAAILVGLAGVNAAIVVMVLYYGQLVLFDRIHPFILIAAGAGAFFGITAMVSHLFSLVGRAEIKVTGTTLSPQEAPLLWEKVEEIAGRLGALRPHQIVAGLEPIFFASAAEVVSLNGTLLGTTLYCSLSLCRILTVEELSFLLGHELGHFRGEDAEYSLKFLPLYRGTCASVASLRRRGVRTFRGLFLLPALAVLDYFLESLSTAERRMSRRRERAADQAGSAVVDAKTAGAALVKVHAFAGVWKGVEQAAAGLLRERRMLVNAAKTYADAVREDDAARALQGLGDRRLDHPTDSLPPLSERLETLGLTIDDVAAAALDVQPAHAAIALLPGAEPLEEKLSDAWQESLIEELGIEPGAESPEAIDEKRAE